MTTVKNKIFCDAFQIVIIIKDVPLIVNTYNSIMLYLMCRYNGLIKNTTIVK